MFDVHTRERLRLERGVREEALDFSVGHDARVEGLSSVGGKFGNGEQGGARRELLEHRSTVSMSLLLRGGRKEWFATGCLQSSISRDSFDLCLSLCLSPGDKPIASCAAVGWTLGQTSLEALLLCTTFARSYDRVCTGRTRSELNRELRQPLCGKSRVEFKTSRTPLRSLMQILLIEAPRSHIRWMKTKAREGGAEPVSCSGISNDSEPLRALSWRSPRRGRHFQRIHGRVQCGAQKGRIQ